MTNIIEIAIIGSQKTDKEILFSLLSEEPLRNFQGLKFGKLVLDEEKSIHIYFSLHWTTFLTFSSDGIGAQTLSRTLASHAVGEWLGEDDHLATISEMPGHNHEFDNGGLGGEASGNASSGYYQQPDAPYTTLSSGGSQATPVRQPTIYCDWIIKL